MYLSSVIQWSKHWALCLLFANSTQSGAYPDKCYIIQQSQPQWPVYCEGNTGTEGRNKWWSLNTFRLKWNGHHFAEEISKWIFFNGNYCSLIIISMKCIPKGPINTMKALVQMMVRCQTSNHGWWWLGDPRSQSISTSETEGLNSADGKSPHSAHGCTCMKSYWPSAKRWLEMEASSHGQLSMSVISILIWQMYNSNVTTLSMQVEWYWYGECIIIKCCDYICPDISDQARVSDQRFVIQELNRTIVSSVSNLPIRNITAPKRLLLVFMMIFLEL